MKRASIFFTASEIYFRALAQRYNKRARNMKLASIFFTASEIYFRRKLKKQTTGSANILQDLLFL